MSLYLIKSKLITISCAIAFMAISGEVFAAEANPKTISDNEFYDQSRTAIVVSKKQPGFILKLTSNPTTGFVWLLKEYDKSLLIPVKHEYEAPKKHLLGASGVELWTFKVKPEAFVAPQRTDIQMIYARPWEKDKDIKEITFTVTTLNE